MSRFANILRPDNGEDATPITLIDKAGFDGWLADQPPAVRAAVAAQKFKADAGQKAYLPATASGMLPVVAGVADLAVLDSWALAGLAQDLPGGSYRLSVAEPGRALLGWLLAHYRFARYRSGDEPAEPRILLTPQVARIVEIERLAEAVALVRDLVNTPAADMGPEQIEQAASALVASHGAELHVTRGDVLEREYPLVHAVGRAAARDYAPRLIEFFWGDPGHPSIAIIGKGVSFDSGGLDIKPASAMRLMKKDMGGAAHALALASLIMAARLPVRLHLLIPAVENAVAGNAFRPGDIVRSRSGLTVEIENTDAEGRLILADALTRAGEMEPELVLDFATLTGAARVALGADLPALFSTDDTLADALLAGGIDMDDPVWRLPLYAGYDKMLKSSVADTMNSSASGFAGAITAALFLQKFVPTGTAWAHFDTYAWRAASQPGRPEGGDALGLMAAYAALKARFPR